MAIATIEEVGRQRFPRWALVLIVMVLMLLAVYGVWRVSLRMAIGRELAAIKAKGYPTTPAELQNWYPPIVAGEENAAEGILAGTKKIRTPEDVFGEEEMDVTALAEGKWVVWDVLDGSVAVGEPKPTMVLKNKMVPGVCYGVRRAKVGEAYPAELMELGRRYLEANAEAMEMLEKAGRMERSRYPADYREGIKVKLPSLAGVRGVVNMFELLAMDAERTGDSGQAAAGVMGQLRIARSMRDEPAALVQIMRGVSGAMAVRSMERAMNRLSFTEEYLREIEGAMAEQENVEGMKRTWAGECAMFQQEIAEYVTKYEGFKERKTAMRIVIGGSGMADYTRLRYVAVMRERLEAMDLPTWEQLSAVKRVDERTGAMQEGWMGTMMQAVPSMNRVVLIWLRDVADLRCARGAMAAERYRMAHGRWPSGWGELVPEYLEGELVDPFTGKPLVMKVEGGRLTVYSLGDDQVDNGGVKKNAKGQMYEAGADITFEVARHPRTQE